MFEGVTESLRELYVAITTTITIVVYSFHHAGCCHQTTLYTYTVILKMYSLKLRIKCKALLDWFLCAFVKKDCWQFIVHKAVTQSIYLSLELELDKQLSQLSILFSSLSGNSLKCTCQLKWLADLLNSDNTLPDISGAGCKDSSDIVYSLTALDVPFTDCPGMAAYTYSAQLF